LIFLHEIKINNIFTALSLYNNNSNNAFDIKLLKIQIMCIILNEVILIELILIFIKYNI